MGRAVYPFRLVVKQLRNDAGLTVLAAAEATAYGNYERWESGQTRVGGQHLRAIAHAFAITDHLHLLVYAWLVDRLTPLPGDPTNRLRMDDVQRCLRDTPDTVVDLREHKHLVLEPSRHVDLALFCLAARYAERGNLVIPPTPRDHLPTEHAEAPLLPRLYGDVLNDAALAVGRALLTRGIDGVRPSTLDVTNIAPALASPEIYRALADELDGTVAPDDAPLVHFAIDAAANARRFAELLVQLRADLGRLIEAAHDEAPRDEQVEDLVASIIAGKTRPVVKLVFRAARRGHLPALDASVTTELRTMRARLLDCWRSAAEKQAVSDMQKASAADVFAALDGLRARHSA
jgi:hypothetical protein